MPEVEHMPFPGQEVPPMSPDQPENKRKKRAIQMKDGTVRFVDSIEEEIEARREDREKE